MSATNSPVALRIFGAFPTPTGVLGLQSLNTYELPDGALAMVRSNSSLYQFDRASTTAPGDDVVQPAAGPGRWIIYAGGGESFQTLAPWIITDLVPYDPGAPVDNVAALQEHIDDAEPFTDLQIWQQDNLLIRSPLRLENQIGLSGLGESTALIKDPLWFAGAMCIVGQKVNPFPHGAAILDDADFSYAFSGADTESYMPIGQPSAGGVFPVDWPGLWLEMAITVTGPVVSPATLFTIHGEHATNIFATSFPLDLSWKFTNDVLLVTVFTDVTGVQLQSTTDFSADIGTRHMIAVGWDQPTQRAYLFVDGVLEAFANLAGTVFTSEPWQMANIGGARVQFAQSPWIQSADFDLGHFYIGDTCKHTANYTVDWNIPTPGSDTRCMVVCQDDREVDDLVKLVSGTVAYSWMRYPTSAGQSADVQIRDIKFATAGFAGGCSIESFSTLRTVVSGVVSLETSVICNGNGFYSTFENIQQTGGQRYGALLSGGLCNYNGLLKFSGAAIGAVFLNGAAVAETIHTYDYTRIGFWFDSWSGDIEFLAASDESTPVGVDPLYGMYWRAPDGIASVTTIANLAIDVINSDSTIPVNIARNRNSIVRIGGGESFLAGLTTPPDYFFLFTTPTLDDPIYADIITYDFLPIANLPYKVITSTGPAGGQTLTAAASTTITPRMALEFDYDGATLVGPTALVFSNDVGDGPKPRDGIQILVRATCVFAGNTLQFQNFDATPFASFTAPGWARCRWSATDNTWSQVEAALYP